MIGYIPRQRPQITPQYVPATNPNFTTNFPLTENPISQGGIWLNGAVDGGTWNDCKTTGGQCVGAANAGAPLFYNDDLGVLKTSYRTFNNDQFAQGTVYRAGGYTPAANHEIELLLRFSLSTNNAHGYEALWGFDAASGNGYVALVRWNGNIGDYTAIYDPGVGAIPVMTDGDVFYAQIVGNFVTLKRNGTNITSPIDITSVGATWASGQPGVGFWPTTGAVPENMGWKSYTAGNM